LADVTGLDGIGMPVYQSVRPWSRALSVHQGKGLTRDAARLGALMEAVECDHAELFSTDVRIEAFDDLPREDRAPCLADFASDREDAPDGSASLTWVPARRVAREGVLWVPLDFVSLDCTRQDEPRIDKSSVGLAAHYDVRAAQVTALLEVIERDAEWVWRNKPLADRSLDRVDPGSIPFEWFTTLTGRIRACGLRLSVYAIQAVIGLPAFICEIVEPTAGEAARQFVYGSAVHFSAEQALMRSLVEAVQSRVTLIAGVRDDIFYATPGDCSGGSLGLGIPLPSGVAAQRWCDAIAPFPDRCFITPEKLALMLAKAGYPDTALIDLSRPEREAVVFKAVSAGLAAYGRTRRPCV
jgi:ribosomal protein S12 methylthiotransferase accessory factor